MFQVGLEQLNLSGIESSQSEPSHETTEFTYFEQLDASTPHLDQLNDHNYFLFSKFIVPQMSCRHPTPTEGRDDDINLLSEVLQDILTKLG